MTRVMLGAYTAATAITITGLPRAEPGDDDQDKQERRQRASTTSTALVITVSTQPPR